MEFRLKCCQRQEEKRSHHIEISEEVARWPRSISFFNDMSYLFMTSKNGIKKKRSNLHTRIIIPKEAYKYMLLRCIEKSCNANIDYASIVYFYFVAVTLPNLDFLHGFFEGCSFSKQGVSSRQNFSETFGSICGDGKVSDQKITHAQRRFEMSMLHKFSIIYV